MIAKGSLCDERLGGDSALMLGVWVLTRMGLSVPCGVCAGRDSSLYLAGASVVGRPDERE